MARRRTDWLSNIVPIRSLASNAAASVDVVTLFSEGTLEAELRGVTLVRLVGDLHISGDGSGTDYQVGVVFGLWPSPQFAAIAAATYSSTNWAENVDDPGTLWTKQWADFGGGGSSQIDMLVPLDIRAQRKIRPNHVLGVAVANQQLAAAGVADIQWSMAIRMLTKLA